jgi:hypothetical protein
MIDKFSKILYTISSYFKAVKWRSNISFYLKRVRMVRANIVANMNNTTELLIEIFLDSRISRLCDPLPSLFRRTIK